MRPSLVPPFAAIAGRPIDRERLMCRFRSRLRVAKGDDIHSELSRYGVAYGKTHGSGFEVISGPHRAVDQAKRERRPAAEERDQPR